MRFSEPLASELFQIIETEIASLYEGNAARYKIRPSQFEAWQNIR